jgi:hypothetical protein
MDLYFDVIDLRIWSRGYTGNGIFPGVRKTTEVRLPDPRQVDPIDRLDPGVDAPFALAFSGSAIVIGWISVGVLGTGFVMASRLVAHIATLKQTKPRRGQTSPQPRQGLPLTPSWYARHKGQSDVRPTAIMPWPAVFRGGTISRLWIGHPTTYCQGA